MIRGMETHLWTWSGHDFGYRDGDELWTYDGRHVGHFYGTEVFAPDGRYLGELQRDDHLITRIVKRPMRRRRAFTPLPDRPARPTFIGFGGFPIPVGYEDFPDPDALR
jgi:hypothetical protein